VTIELPSTRPAVFVNVGLFGIDRRKGRYEDASRLLACFAHAPSGGDFTH
jgi:hypothetical protein